ncbi:MAG: hypothetical protein AMJ88_06240 [Anaerolineae bacterium SM23_ 63]|nr:MAG: hypothetical protein AMJ88_06240 [Anaerolineae bacterium SM23_ 63]HEY47532.1 hypothetical protein [Anaerolineae bacterium]
MVVRLLKSSAMLAMLVSCAAPPTTASTISSPTSTTPLKTPASVVGITPLEWLGQSPFKPIPPELPEIITDRLPSGFNALEPGLGTSELPGGHLLQMLGVDYQRPIGDQVYIENSVSVQIFSYDSRNGRTEHLNILAAQGYEWTFEEVANQRVAAYRTSGADGRIWISGPFLIVVFSGLDSSERGPWVDTFTEVYLAKFPPP